LISPNAARAALMARKTSDRLPLDWRASQPAGPQAARGFARRSESFRGHSSCSRPPPKPRPGRRRSSSGITDLLAPSDARHSAFDSRADVYTSSLSIYTHIGCHAPRPVLGGRRWSGDRRDGSSVRSCQRNDICIYIYLPSGASFVTRTTSVGQEALLRLRPAGHANRGNSGRTRSGRSSCRGRYQARQVTLRHRNTGGKYEGH
jgi:hypothetical protein